jgi:RNA-splicing ligase RtcB
MIQFKPDKYSAYNKIMKVIDSCETIEHINIANNMVITFEKVFNITIENKEMIKDLQIYINIKRAILNG